MQDLTNNKGDSHVLATAVSVKAEVIVTFNLKHFLLKDTINWGIKAEHPDVFKLSLFQDNSSLMIKAINEQVARFRHPPITTKQLLEILAKDTPEFVKEFSKYIS